MAVERAAQAKKLEAQETAMLEARRRLRLLERLKERRLAEWRAAENRELETWRRNPIWRNGAAAGRAGARTSL